MARKNSMSCLEKRDLLNQSAVSVETLKRWGRSFEESDMIYDAVSFYEKANDRESLSRLREDARGEGNVMLFKRLCQLTGHEPDQKEWMLLAQQAEQMGKHLFAAEAYRRSGDDAAAERCVASLRG